MAQRVSSSTVSTNIPGAYSNVTVKSTPVGIGATGIIAIIGEANAGDSYETEILKDNFYSPDQLDRVQAKYVSGPIVDAMRALSAPSADAGIVGSATRVYILKTNNGAKASALIDTDYGTLSASSQGKDGNKFKYQVLTTQEEVVPAYNGTVIPAFGAALNQAEFRIRINGGAEFLITLSNTPANHADIATLVTEIQSLLPVGIECEAGTPANSLSFFLPVDASANRRGWGKSFEITGDSADLTALGLAENLYTSSAEPEIELNVVRSDINLNATVAAAAEVALLIGYEGTTATVSITSSALTTTVVGGSGSNLSIELSQYQTVQDLADFINSQTGYTASVAPNAVQMRPTDLDKVTTIGIATSDGNRPGRIKRSLSNFKRAVSTISQVSFEETATAGLPKQGSMMVFLSGGTKGSTTGADIIDALTKLEAVGVNFVIPLMSRDASEDIAEGLTESSSSYTIDAIHAAVKSHVLKMSTVKLKRNRLAVLSFWGTYAQAAQKAQTLANYRQSMTFQKVSQVNAEGNVVSFLPWYGACVAAGMQAAGFYRGITNKFANIISFEDPSGFDSGSPGDVEKALDAGLLMLQKETAGSKWVSDQTTYGFDTNFVYNSIQASYLADIAALDLTDSFQRAFVGQSLADVDAATGLSFLADKMNQFKSLKIIASSDDAPLGYRNPKITINGPVLEVSVEIKLSTTLYFVLLNIEISQIQQSAGQ